MTSQLNSPWEAFDPHTMEDGDVVLAACVDCVTLSSEIMEWNATLDQFMFFDGTPFEGEVDAIIRVPPPTDTYLVGGTIDNGDEPHGGLH